MRGLILDEADGRVVASVREIAGGELPALPVRVRVIYSTLNFKDAMVVTGLGRIVRSYPHVPGVDLVGEVLEDESGSCKPGDLVVVTGFRMGEATWGGYAEEARVKPEWIVPLADGLSARQAMAIGTAGLTAMLALHSITDAGVAPGETPLLVTGASGGVGSIAVAIAHARGFAVAASTGKSNEHEYLRSLGANEIIDRSEFSESPSKPLEPARWCAAIEAVGGATLAKVISGTAANGVIASVGNASGNEFCASVLPFLLRGVRIHGIDSVQASLAARRRAWDDLSELLDARLLESITDEIGLDEVPDAAARILAGGVRGRLVVRVAGS